MCPDGLATYEQGEKLATWTVDERRPFGADASVGGFLLTVEDARTDQTVFVKAGPSEAPDRNLLITKRHPDVSCAVTDPMRQALRAGGFDFFANDPSLKGECVDRWVRLASNEPGDSTLMLRPKGEGWEFYTGFPTGICRSEYRTAGGPQAFEAAFRDC